MRIKQIMIDYDQINLSKRGIQKIVHNYKAEGMYVNRKRSGRQPKFLKCRT